MTQDKKNSTITYNLQDKQTSVNEQTQLLTKMASRLNEIHAELVMAPRKLHHAMRAEATRDTASYINSTPVSFGTYIDNSDMQNKTPFWDAVIKNIHVEAGNIGLEFGVFRGKSIAYFGNRLPCQLFGFDSFEGLPEAGGTWEKGTFAVTATEIVAQPPTVELIKGWFDQSLPAFLKQHDLAAHGLCYLHIDCDLYSSTVTVLDLLEPYIKQGCVITFDEYWNYPGWRHGEFKAWAEFIERTGKKFEYLAYSSHQQVAVRVL